MWKLVNYITSVRLYPAYTTYQAAIKHLNSTHRIVVSVHQGSQTIYYTNAQE